MFSDLIRQTKINSDDDPVNFIKRKVVCAHKETHISVSNYQKSEFKSTNLNIKNRFSRMPRRRNDGLLIANNYRGESKTSKVRIYY